MACLHQAILPIYRAALIVRVLQISGDVFQKPPWLAPEVDEEALYSPTVRNGFFDMCRYEHPIWTQMLAFLFLLVQIWNSKHV